MFFKKTEIAGKLKKLKGLLNNRQEGINGVLVNGNTLYATNHEISIRATLDIPSSDEKFVVPKAAIELIENLPNETVEITGDGKSVLIKCGSIKHKVQSIDINSYPAVKEIDTATVDTKISSSKFLDALDSVLYAVSEHSSKEVLQGVLLDARTGILNIVGCDGYRMAWSKIKYDGEFKVVIPKTAIRQILSIGISGDISLTWDNSSIKLSSDEYEVYSRILTGEYLDYMKMFVDYPNQAIINRKRLCECLKRAIICLDDKVNNVIRCKFDNDILSVSLHKSTAEYEELVNLEKPAVKLLEIGFNGKYLLESMNSFASDKVSVRMGSKTQPFIIDDGDLLALVLPVRIVEEAENGKICE